MWSLWRSSKLKTKFTVLLSLVFISGTLLSGLVFSRAVFQRAEEFVVSQALILMETMNSVRDYTTQHINPLLDDRLETSPKFIPETVPAYSATEVFESFRKKGNYADYLYREAVLNPTNLRDLADSFEAKLVAQFIQQPDKTELSGYRVKLGNRVFYSARPIVITEASCLRCHGVPDDAPKSQLASYGRNRGFGWQINQTVGTQIIYVPAQRVLNSAQQAFLLVMGGFVGIFALLMVLINFLLQKTVIQTVAPMAVLAQRLSEDTLSADDPQEFENIHLERVTRMGDELGQLGRLLQRMAREIYAREQELKQRVKQLQIEIDHVQRAQQVAEITETEYFRDLEQKARQLRQNLEPTDRPEDNTGDSVEFG